MDWAKLLLGRQKVLGGKEEQPQMALRRPTYPRLPNNFRICIFQDRSKIHNTTKMSTAERRT